MTLLFPDAEPPKAPPAKKQAQGAQPEAIRLWDEHWLRTRGSKYVWTGKDAALIAKARSMAEEDQCLLEARVRVLLDETEDQWIARNASPGLLVERWNQLAYAPPKKQVVSRLPAYKGDTGPRIPPPSNLMDMMHEAVSRCARKGTGTSHG